MLEQLDLFGNPIQENETSKPEPTKSTPSRRAELLKAAVEKLQETGVKKEEEVVGFREEVLGVRDEEIVGVREEMPVFTEEEVVGVEEEVYVKEEEEEIAFEIPAIRKVTEKVDNRPTPQKGKRGRKSLKEIKDEVQYVQIPEDEKLFQRQYYSIGEVADMFNVNTSLIRFWENSFDILKPRKNRKGDRHFRPEDVKNLHLIYHLLREKKYTIEGAKDYMKSQLAQAKQQHDVLQRLQKVKQFLLELKSQL
jgi:DNA-binding transcriptional MerR regulator